MWKELLAGLVTENDHIALLCDVFGVEPATALEGGVAHFGEVERHALQLRSVILKLADGTDIASLQDRSVSLHVRSERRDIGSVSLRGEISLAGAVLSFAG